MMLIRYTLLFFLVFSFGYQAIGQQARHLPGQFLVSLDPDFPAQQLIRQLTDVYPGIHLPSMHRVSRLLNVWLLNVKTEVPHEAEILNWLRRAPGVRLAQYNHLLETRSRPLPMILPNDPLFNQQWQHLNTGAGGGIPNADFDSDLAWNITRGGVTTLGDTIVVAVIDGGLDFQHEDLVENLWRNYDEVPGDGLDNDGNGYTDDFRGWNVFDSNDNIAGQSTGHGTPVAAIVAAKGNNNKGITGVNWDTKLMFVAGNGLESFILAAYDYVLQARKRYNASNGQQGAFVVAVNCSWGITYGQPSEAPLWCAAFDSLGAAGIVSVAATDNHPNNVDLVGDLPTGCPSDFLIAVTSLNKSDQKAGNAAWGPISVDLGAYGKEVFSAGPGNTYGTFSGTSFAAPQVTGAVGLLYSAPCFNLAAMAKTNPAAAALWVKYWILNTATPNASLQNLTLTGGRLNLFSLLQAYENQCSDCLAPFAIDVSPATTQQTTIFWSQLPDVQSVSLRWKRVGDLTWNIVSDIQSPYVLTGLSPCTNYELSLQSHCPDALESSWTDPVEFQTDGCCVPPVSVGAISTGPNTASLTWSSVTAASAYRVRVRSLPNGPWQEFQTATNLIDLDGLTTCTPYELMVQTLCGNDSAGFSAAFGFMTGGCGACTDLPYCEAYAAASNDEWIGQVQIGSWSHNSGSGPGYENFTGSLLEILKLTPGSAWPLTLTPAFSGWPYMEYFRVFIDYNADGDFTDPGELAFDPGYASDAPIVGTLFTPVYSYVGLTRMRVSMKYKGPNDTAPGACEIFEFGQVEDYCVNLDTLVTTGQTTVDTFRLFAYPQPARSEVYLQLPVYLNGASRFMALDISGNVVMNQQINVSPQTPLKIDISRWPVGIYGIRLEHEKGVYWQKIVKME